PTIDFILGADDHLFGIAIHGDEALGLLDLLHQIRDGHGLVSIGGLSDRALRRFKPSCGCYIGSKPRSCLLLERAGLYASPAIGQSGSVGLPLFQDVAGNYVGSSSSTPFGYPQGPSARDPA